MYYQNNGMTQYDITDVIYKEAQTDSSCVYALEKWLRKAGILCKWYKNIRMQFNPTAYNIIWWIQM